MKTNDRKNFERIRINEKEYVGVREAAKLAGVSEHTMRREMARKHIRYFRHPRGHLFLPEWIDEWAARKTTKPTGRM